jgi:hypothetical protein
MVLKIISFIFVISLVFGITNPNQIKDVPFNVNDIINQVSLPNGEFLIDTSIVYIPTPNDQLSPVIAFDGTNYLVVWRDVRSGSPDIYGARVSQIGTVLDPIGIQISTATGDQKSLAVTFNGFNYLVVWEDDRNGPYSDIYGARVSQAGTVLDPNGIPVSVAAWWQESPSVAFDGSNYLVVWEDERFGSNDIYGARVSQAGSVLDPNGFAISFASNDQYSPSISFDGTDYLVVWEDNRNDTSDIYGTRISQAGNVIDPNGIAISTAANRQFSPSVAFNETNYLVVWQDNRSDSYSDIYGTRVTQAGIILDTNGIAISIDTNRQFSPSIAFDGTNHLVVWQDYRNGYYPDIYGARVTQTGFVLDFNGIAITTASYEQESPAIGFGGTTYLVVWQDSRSNYPYDIYGTRISQAGTILDPNGFTISTVANLQRFPTIAFDGTNYLVTWVDRRNALYEYDIYGARITQSGVALDSNGFAISTAAYNQESPAIAFDGTNYLVVWTDKRNGPYSDIYGTRVSQVGTLLDPNGIAISTATNQQYFPVVIFDGTNYLVVWQDNRSDPYSDIYGTRISQTGIILEPNGIVISTDTNRQFSPSIAFDGTNHLVVWEDLRNNSNWNIYGARISQAGIVIDTNGIPISTTTNNKYSPAIAFDGTNYLVVWEEERSDSRDIYGSRVSQNGTVLDSNGIIISNATNNQRDPAVTFDGTSYFVIWTDYRTISDTPDIYGAKVSPTGALIDSFQVSIQDGNQGLPTLAHGLGNQVLITYEGWTGEYQSRIYNTNRIWGKFYPFVGIMEENSKVKMQKAKLLEVYPNPAKGVMRVHGPFSEKTIKIFDICGKMIREIASTASQSRNDGAVEISLKGMNPGIYFLKLDKETKKFLVVK